jgi:DNA-binding phage protein
MGLAMVCAMARTASEITRYLNAFMDIGYGSAVLHCIHVLHCSKQLTDETASKAG